MNILSSNYTTLNSNLAVYRPRQEVSPNRYNSPSFRALSRKMQKKIMETPEWKKFTDSFTNTIMDFFDLVMHGTPENINTQGNPLVAFLYKQLTDAVKYMEVTFDIPKQVETNLPATTSGKVSANQQRRKADIKWRIELKEAVEKLELPEEYQVKLTKIYTALIEQKYTIDGKEKTIKDAKTKAKILISNLSTKDVYKTIDNFYYDRLKLEKKKTQEEGPKATTEKETDPVTSPKRVPSKGPRLYKVVFPQIGHRPRKNISSLKEIVAKLRLPKEYAEKMAEICKIAIQKEYTTKSRKEIICSTLTDSLIEGLSKQENILETIDFFYYDELEFEKRTIEKEEVQPKAPELREDIYTLKEIVDKLKLPKEYAEKMAEICKIAIQKEYVTGNGKKIIGSELTDLLIKELSKQEITQDELISKIDRVYVRLGLGAEVVKDIQTTPKTNGAASVGPRDATFTVPYLDVKLVNTPQDPNISFVYNAAGTRNPLFAEPELIIQDNSVRYSRNSLDPFTDLLRMLNSYFKPKPDNEKRRENVKIWANGITSEHEKPSSNHTKDPMKDVKIYIDSVGNLTQNIQTKDIIEEVNSSSDESYNNIKDAIHEDTFRDGRLRTSPLNSALVADIADAINEEERFQHFELKGALQFINKIVNFDSDTSIKDQCSHALDDLFNLMEDALHQGVQVNTSMHTTNSYGKKNEIIVKVAPNITIPKNLYNEEQKKLFKNEDIVISLCEYQPGGKFDAEQIIPIIKTIMINNSW